MKQIFPNLKSLFPVFEGIEAFLLSKLFSETTKDICFIVQNEKKMMKLEAQIKYFLPEIDVICFNHWDCLAYDRVSPSVHVIASRIRSLYDIVTIKRKKIILVTVNSILQKTIPKNIFLKNTKLIKKGDVIERDDLLHFLVKSGFNSASVANEPGNFAVRGSIIDIYDIRSNLGIRLDFFGKELESLKYFDPISQITTKSIDQALILPVSEIIYNDETINNFCNQYKELFTKNILDDPIYNSVINKRKFQGIEHFLPLFYNKLDNFFDYLEDCEVIFESYFLTNLSEYQKNIDDNFNARFEDLNAKFSFDDFSFYPVPKNLMWFEQNEFIHKIGQFNPLEFAKFEEDDSRYTNLDFKAVPNFSISTKPVIEELKEYKAQISKKIIISVQTEGSVQRVKTIFDANNVHSYFLNNFQDYKSISTKAFGIAISPLESGFEGQDFAIICEQDIFGLKINTKVKATKKLENLLSEAASFQKGELVVHTQHGIGRFEGLETLSVLGVGHDFLLITYDGGDKLYLPVENVEIITRYGEDSENAKLDKLGGINWQERKAKIKNRIKEIAAELLKIAAERELRRAEIILPNAASYDEFVARFPYIETDDQLSAIEDVESDLSSGKPMDRLVCGDVGFGKTEIALRAAFIVTHADDGIRKQVAVIVPTTLLAKQHYENFTKRFTGFGLRIAELSRLVSTKDAKLVKDGLENGSIDIVIGTHALLAKDLKFHNLQLVIIDEEQHFGVAQKERLKQLKNNIHILTLSATPIPRTMQMSLVGIKELSLIASPPIDRIAIKSYVMPYDNVIIKEAMMREYHRGGKCFFVAPRISDLAEIKLKLSLLVPELKTVIAHGQKTPLELDKIMHDFYNGKYDILISTTIIESGLDIPAANTIFIHRSDMFGLSALYQLRGRVGRGSAKAYAYLLLPNNKTLSKIATKRLEVMQTLDSLGVGFSIATHDMDIRGFGNLLGDEQSGHVREVGVELYQNMLKSTIDELKNEVKQDLTSWSPQINIGIPVLIPEAYISDIHVRMGIYRRVATLASNAEIEEFKAELIDRFGKYPEDIENLFTIVALKILCKKANIEKIDAGEKGVVVAFRENKFSNPEKLLTFAMNSGYIKVRPDEKIVFVRTHTDIIKRVAFAFACVNQIIALQ